MALAECSIHGRGPHQHSSASLGWQIWPLSSGGGRSPEEEPRGGARDPGEEPGNPL